LFSTDNNRPRSILITSTVADEGKSFIASNLAVSFAQNINEHVLLIDSDLRNPKIHKYFGFDDVPGLSEYLANDFTLPSLLLKTNISKLSILPAGNPPFNPAELLSSNKMQTLLSEVTSRYPDRYIVIDTPPPQFTSETSAIASQVDGIIFVVSSGATSRTNISKTIEMIGKDKILGVVFNKHDQRYSRSFSIGKHNHYYQYYNRQQ
jgi:exopolysaccharide/PEP-CTERM locus tyrosine autokinase